MSICGRNQVGSIEAPRQDADEGRGFIMFFGTLDAQATMRAKTAFVLSTGQAWCEMVTQLAFRQSKGLCRQQHGGSKPAARDLLAIPAMAFEHHDRFSCAPSN